MQRVQNIAKILRVDLNMINVIDKKQMYYDSIITRKENASED